MGQCELAGSCEADILLQSKLGSASAFLTRLVTET